MQESWRRNVDKLTFIVCTTPSPLPGYESHNPPQQLSDGGTWSQDKMIGDVNLFLRLEDEDSDHDDSIDGDQLVREPKQQLVGEIELMVAEKDKRRQGYGRAALLCFLRYILENESAIVNEYFSQGDAVGPTALSPNNSATSRHLSYLSVKIAESNIRSLNLFESLGFTRVTEKANVFGELELRRGDLQVVEAQNMLQKYGIDAYVELSFNQEE